MGDEVRETEVGRDRGWHITRQGSAHPAVLSGPSRPWCVFA